MSKCEHEWHVLDSRTLYCRKCDIKGLDLIAQLQAVVDAAKAVVESEADARRQQVTHWKNPTIDILEQAIKEVESE